MQEQLGGTSNVRTVPEFLRPVLGKVCLCGLTPANNALQISTGAPSLVSSKPQHVKMALRGDDHELYAKLFHRGQRIGEEGGKYDNY